MSGSGIRSRAGAFVMALAALALFGCPRGGASYEVKSPPDKTTTHILVRHAEKENQAIGSPLNAAGRERARALVNRVAPFGITAI